MRHRRFSPHLMLAAPALLCLGATALAQTPAGTAVTYQGRLKDNGSVANGTYDFRFRLYDADTAGTQIGSNQLAADLAVTDGLFTATVDFGASAFTKDARWLETGVRPGTSVGAYTVLNPRQRIQPAPQAIQSLNDANWSLSGSDIVSSNSGDVGIGVNNPNAKLHVKAVGTTQFQPPNALRVTSEYPLTLSNTIEFLDFKGNEIHAVQDNQFSTLALQPDGGTVGIGVENSLDVPLHVMRSTAGTVNSDLQFEDVIIEDAANAWLGLYSDDAGNVGSGIVFAENAPGVGVDNLKKWAMYARTTSNVGDLVVTYGTNTNPTSNEVMLQIDRDGTTKVKVLEILGADVAERFPCSESVEPGHVVMIDAANPGKLCLARGPYNRRVAGIVSGAGDLPAGAILGNLPNHEKAPPVALSGRVWVHVDATTRGVEPGDMLTTADRPGYAMGVEDPARAVGATIGKAMTVLEKGRTGLVLVLVNLQ